MQVKGIGSLSSKEVVERGREEEGQHGDFDQGQDRVVDEATDEAPDPGARGIVRRDFPYVNADIRYFDICSRYQQKACERPAPSCK